MKGSSLAAGSDIFKFGSFFIQSLRLYLQALGGKIVSRKWNGGAPAVAAQTWDTFETVVDGSN